MVLDRYAFKNQFGIANASEDDLGLPRMYGTPEMHRTPNKVNFIVGASKSSSLLKILTSTFQIIIQRV